MSELGIEKNNISPDSVTITVLASYAATSRRALLDSLSVCLSITSPLTAELPCGNSKAYYTEDEVPSESVECLCGRVPHRHFFILYSAPRYTMQEGHAITAQGTTLGEAQ